jgi:hypothetical protein
VAITKAKKAEIQAKFSGGSYADSLARYKSARNYRASVIAKYGGTNFDEASQNRVAHKSHVAGLIAKYGGSNVDEARNNRTVKLAKQNRGFGDGSQYTLQNGYDGSPPGSFSTGGGDSGSATDQTGSAVGGVNKNVLLIGAAAVAAFVLFKMKH